MTLPKYKVFDMAPVCNRTRYSDFTFTHMEQHKDLNSYCLQKVLGQSSLTEEQLNTTLISIEAAVNSRPITYSGDLDTLTPAHFSIGGGLVTIPTGLEPETRKDLTKEFHLRLKLSDDFWKRWQKEYLLQLRNFHEYFYTLLCC